MKQAYINGIILNGKENMEPIIGKTILVENGIIEDIVDSMESLDSYEIVDLKGQYIMPGFINLHVHLVDDGCPKDKEFNAKELVRQAKESEEKRNQYKKKCEENARMQLYSGVTTIRCVGGVDNFDSELRDKIAKNEVIGPRILTSNMGITVPEGHCANYLAYVANNEQEVISYVEKLDHENVDLIKLMITGGVLDAKKWGEPGVLRMPSSYIKVACDKAHELGYKVAAHIESQEGLRVALQNGVDSIEHGGYPDAEIISLFKKRNAALVSTLSVGIPFVLQDKGIGQRSIVEHNGIVVFEGMVECVKQCLENHIMVGLGNDAGCPYVTHYDFWRELYYLHKYCNVSNNYAIHCATLQNAKIAGIDSICGSIEKGKSADFLICEKNPLEDLRNLKNVSMVISRGNMYTSPTLHRFEKVEALLNL